MRMWDASPGSTANALHRYIYIVYYDNVHFGREFFLSARAIVLGRAAAAAHVPSPPPQSFIMYMYYYYYV